MDAKLSEFITRTSADPGLARDLLESHSWNLKNALNAFYVMKGIATLDSGDVNDQPSSKKNSLSSHQSVSNNIIIPVIPSNLKSSSEPSLSPSPTNSTNSSPSKLAISRLDVSDTDILEELYPKKLSRGISRAADNVFLVSRARNQFAYDFGLLSGWTPDEKDETDHEVNELKKHRQSPVEAPFTTTPEYTFTLPDLSIHPPDFSQFLEKDLIEKSSLVSLEGAGRLNWWTDSTICQKLWPLATTGDGNCLLHAASLGIWGFHDRLLTLRKALHAILEKSKMSDSFYRRWRFQSSQQNRAAGLILCEDEWQKEWKSLLNMASTRPRVRHSSQPDKKTSLTGGKKVDSQIEEEEPEPHVYESLEELHILALAHVLRRPIIVVADTMLKDVTGEPFAPIPFGGIYLPLEHSEQECHRSPLCLTYDAAHFSALVAMDKESFADSTPLPPAAIPLEDKEGKLLPLQFAIDPGIDVDWSHSDETRTMTDDDKLALLKKYLEVVLLNQNCKQTTEDSQESCSESDSLLKSNANEVQEEKSDPKVSEEQKNTLDKSQNVSPSSERQGMKRKMFEGLRHRFSFIRKSMTKRLRFKHLSTLAKRGTSFRFKRRAKIAVANNSTSQNVADNVQEISHNATSATSSNANRTTSLQQGIHCALLHTDKKHDYHEEMVRNYLTTARIRFMESQKKDQSKKGSETTRSSTSSDSSSTTSSSSSATSKEKNDDHFASQCVNTGCLNYGTAATSYLCTSCFSDQKQEMEKQEECRVTKPSSLPADSKSTSDLKDQKETIELTDDGSEEDLKKPPNMLSNESNLVNSEVISC